MYFRSDNRAIDQLRPVNITPGFITTAEGSALIEVGKGRLVPDDIPRLFELRDRSQSGPTVPPEGLYLVGLEYPDPTDSLASSTSRRSAHTGAFR